MTSRSRGLGRLGGLKSAHTDVNDEMADRAARMARLKGVKPVVVSSFNLFPTPPEIARRMVQWLDLQSGHKVLEPSAGTGNLLKAIAELDPYRRHIEATAVEINPELCHYLTSTDLCMWSTVRCCDFLQWNGALTSPSILFDRIIMNPPFKNGCDRHHVDHALRMLKPGGILVTLMANGPRQREWFSRTLQNESYPNACWRDLPAGSFKSEGTGVDVGMIQITKG